MSEITIYREFPQNTSYWRMCRMGMPTASRFATVMSAKGSTERKTRDRYMDELVGEIYTGNPYEGYRNTFMDAGHMMEEEARIAYLAGHGCENMDHDVAFVRNNHFHTGCSPDALIGDDGGVEIKTLISPLMVRLLLNPRVTPEHMPQIQGLMWVTGRKWWDLFVYCPGFRPHHARVDRDDGYIQDLAHEVQLFNEELEAKVVKLTGETLASRRRLLDRRLAELMEEDRAAGDLEPAPVPA